MTLPGAQDLSANQTVPQGSGQQAGAQTPAAPLTQEQIQFLIPLIQEHSRPVAKEAADSAFRGMQGNVARLENAFNAKVDELKTLGITPTPEQQKIIRDNVTKEIEQGSVKAGGQPANQQPQNQGYDPVAVAAQEIYTEYGTTLNQGDPELAMVVETGTERTFYKTLEAAVVAKKQRLEKANAVNSPSNVPLVGQRTGKGNSIAGITDVDELYKLAQQH